MVTADWVALGIVVVAAVLGLLLGFGKCLKGFTKGIIGFIISIVVVYFLFGIVASLPFVKDLMAKLIESMQAAENGFLDFLITIGIEKIIIAVGTFIVVQLARIILVSIIKSIVEIDNKVMRTINKFLGMVFMLAVVTMVALLIFHFAAWLGGSTRQSLQDYLSGSAFRLDWVFENNPLNSIFEKIGS